MFECGSLDHHFSRFDIIACYASISKSGQLCAAVCGQMVVVSGPAVPCLLYWDMWVVSYFNPQCCQEYLRE